MDSNELRQSFIRFFEERGHRFVRSAPVVPLDDPTLLFTNAGMNQFKPIFLGEQEPRHSRVVNSQKCIRVSGKHNDLEEVGVDTFHHTFFEMLGNWSFGDYYKAEAIRWAWELVTEVWGLDKRRLWATVYEDDDEAYALWPKVTDIPPERVLKFDAKENFWEMGDTGPCGPCSEIHYFVGDDLKQQSAAGINASDQYWELWNLVFIQFHRDEQGRLNDLPAKHVDTGAGLERIVAVMQNKTSNYDTDLFQPIIRQTEALTGVSYADHPVPHRVIADHIRMLSFSLADGALPSNEGRGYVLRRILRRAARFGRMLGQHEPFIYQLVDTVGEVMGQVYPEVVEKQSHIRNVIRAEETAFNDTLDRGLVHFERVVKNLAGTVISGKEAFRLYDTYGFPLDLTQLMARERGLSVDTEAFSREMEQQRQRAKAAGKFRRQGREISWNTVSTGPDSQFRGYEVLETDSQIRRWAADNGKYILVLDQTPFYAESGGQIGDAGTITGTGIQLQVVDTIKDGDTFLHYCTGEFDSAHAADPVHCQVDRERRQAIRLNHTATHLLHAALKAVLGEHVHQAGSLVAPDYLRFDLTHFEKITPEEITRIETIVNRQIQNNTPLDVAYKPFEEARAEGAVALFGEKYSDTVRVVTVGEFSKELCGGTHVDRTGDIGFFKIVEESALAAGVRRIVAITGQKAVEYVQHLAVVLDQMQQLLKCSADELPRRVEQLLAQRKELEKALKRRTATPAVNMSALVKQARRVGEVPVVIHQVDSESMAELKQHGDDLRDALRSGIGLLGTVSNGKPGVVVVVTDDLIARGLHAGQLAREVGGLLGGGGGGKAHLATAGGKDPARLPAVLDQSFELITRILAGRNKEKGKGKM
jgi:alanyl-tRNA synthetase